MDEKENWQKERFIHIGVGTKTEILGNIFQPGQGIDFQGHKETWAKGKPVSYLTGFGCVATETSHFERLFRSFR